MHKALEVVGSRAREKAPPLVPASAIGSSFWCRLKAWHNTTLFNTGWLSLNELSEEDLTGLAVLWAAELDKKANPRIVIGRLIHGENIRDVIDDLEHYAALRARLVKIAREIALSSTQPASTVELVRSVFAEGLLPLGLIEPGEYEEQLKRYMEARDVVEYFRKEKWPLIARRTVQGFTVIGVPDSIEEASGGVRVVELKTTSKPYTIRRGVGYRAAVAQLASYVWILSQRWPVEEAVLVFRDETGRLVARKQFEPAELLALFEEKLYTIASELASTSPPHPQEKKPCRSCEYKF